MWLLTIFSLCIYSRLFHIPRTITTVQNLFKHFISHTTSCDGQQITQAKLLCEAIGCEYFRLSPPLMESVSMATTDCVKLIDMLYTTQMYCWDNPELIDEVAKCLLLK